MIGAGHVQVYACAELATQACDEGEAEEDPYNIDVDWPPVRAVPAMPETSKAVDVVAFDAVETPAPQRWVPWARGAYDPAVHGCSSGLRKRV
jgi:hypothetical protein